MKLIDLRIRNFRSCEDVTISIGSLHALVGANNAGKSAILHALDFFFNPSTSKITKETFWNHDTAREIRVEAVFEGLSEDERGRLAPYLCPEGSFHVARTGTLTADAEGIGDASVSIGQHYSKPQPKPVWLRDHEISQKAIDAWWTDKTSLNINDISFGDFLGSSKPKVGTWKEKAKEFTAAHLTAADFEDTWTENPQGYANVLKGSLPHFVLVPAIRDLTDEAKATKSNPFGRLLYAIVDGVTSDQRSELEGFVKNLQHRLNREGGAERLASIVEAEGRLNSLLKEYMECDLEIEFQAPTLEVVLTSPRLYADDGFRNLAENKGHGLQRAIIFAILRAYSELVTGSAESKKKPLILAVEEPEIYMHPQAQRTLRRVFLEISRKGDQVFFSTHSALLVDVASFDEIVRCEAVRDTTEVRSTIRTRVWQLPMQNLIDDLKARHPHITATADAIRELYANAYHPNRSEGFFARRVILVEGSTEHYALPLYADALGHRLDNLNVSVVDCGGKGQMDRLYRVFNELGIPAYMVFDYDASSTDLETRRKSEELLSLAGEAAIPSAAFLVGRQVACFPQKWEMQLEAEVPEYRALEAEAKTHLGLKDEGKPLVSRHIAKSLGSRTPPVIPQSLKRIIEAAIVVEWRSSCLKSSDVTP
jgi:hypothetical protein